MSKKVGPDDVGLPPRIFMYTPDQIATMLELTDQYVKNYVLFYDKREPGITPKTKMRAINIAPEGETPVWRISEKEVIRYLRNKGIKFYTRGFLM